MVEAHDREARGAATNGGDACPGKGGQLARWARAGYRCRSGRAGFAARIVRGGVHDPGGSLEPLANSSRPPAGIEPTPATVRREGCQRPLAATNARIALQQRITTTATGGTGPSDRHSESVPAPHGIIQCKPLADSIALYGQSQAAQAREPPRATRKPDVCRFRSAGAGWRCNGSEWTRRRRQSDSRKSFSALGFDHRLTAVDCSLDLAGLEGHTSGSRSRGLRSPAGCRSVKMLAEPRPGTDNRARRRAGALGRSKLPSCLC
jgi:hypothetical protein